MLKPRTRAAIFIGVAALFAAALALAVVRYVHVARLKRIEGAWEGAMHFHAGPRLRIQRIVLRIFKENGSYHAVFDEIDLGMRNLPAAKFHVGGSSMNFESDYDFSYQGKLNGAATEINGRWKWAGGSYSQPLSLKRTAAPDPAQEPLAEVDYTLRPGSDLQGFWKGTLKIGKAVLRLHLKIAEAPDGTFRGELNSIDQVPFIPVPLTTLECRKPIVKFSLQGIGAAFAGELSPDGSGISGTWMQATSVPLTLERVDPRAEAQALAAGKNYGYTNDTELPGHWRGTLRGRNGLPLRLVFNIAQAEDGSLAATLDRPGQSLFAAPFDVVVFTPPHVRLEIKSANGVFDGKLSEGKLSGTWRSNTRTVEPLTLERDKSD